MVVRQAIGSRRNRAPAQCLYLPGSAPKGTLVPVSKTVIWRRPR